MVVDVGGVGRAVELPFELGGNEGEGIVDVLPLRMYSNHPPASPELTQAVRMASNPNLLSPPPTVPLPSELKILLRSNPVPSSCTIPTPIIRIPKATHCVKASRRLKKAMLNSAAVRSLS